LGGVFFFFVFFYFKFGWGGGKKILNSPPFLFLGEIPPALIPFAKKKNGGRGGKPPKNFLGKTGKIYFPRFFF